MDRLDRASVAPLLRGTWGDPWLHVAECASTQDLLRGSGLPEGAVATTEHQTAGRGRAGRRWEDAPGASLLVSVLLRPPAGPKAAELSLVCALAAAETVESATGLETRVKWPNDVLVHDAKVVGILLELDGDAVIAGLGINVNQAEEELPRDTRLPAASLRTATGRRYERAPLLVALLAGLEARYDEWKASGLERIAEGLEARNWLRGRRVETDGRAATAGGIRPDGLLEVCFDDGEKRAVESGEIVSRVPGRGETRSGP